MLLGQQRCERGASVVLARASRSPVRPAGRRVAYLLSEKTGRFAASLVPNLSAKKLSCCCCHRRCCWNRRTLTSSESVRATPAVCDLAKHEF